MSPSSSIRPVAGIDVSSEMLDVALEPGGTKRFPYTPAGLVALFQWLTRRGVERTDGDFAITWVDTAGKGRVFVSVLGHRETVWDEPNIQKMWLEAAKWVLGMTDGDTAPLSKPTE